MNDSINSPHTTDRRMSSQKQQFVPCSTAIIHSAKFNHVDGMFTYQNYHLHNVIVIGYIKSVQTSSTYLAYDLHDGTSESGLKVRKWIEDKSKDFEKYSFCRENCFVRVLGDLRHQADDDSRFVVAYSILPLETSNELSFHLVDVVAAHSLLPKLQMNDSFIEKSVPFQDKINSFNKHNENNEDVGDMGLDSVSKQILGVLNQCTSSEGLHISEIQKKLPKLTESIIRKKLGFLAEEAHVYSTITEDHFYVTK